MKENNNNLELKKHVAAIHSSSQMSLIQRKIANALLFNAYNELQEQEEHTISIRELTSLIGYKSNDIQTIKKSLIGLLSTVLEWNLLDSSLDEGETWNASSIIADANIDGSLCTYSYSKRMKELLYIPAMYGRLNMKLQSKFKSTYGLALYENIIRYQNLPCTPWFQLETFRRLMGVPSDKYLIFRDFKKRVIESAREEVNSICSIELAVEYKRRCRNILAIRFAKLKRAKNEINISSSLVAILSKQYGFSKVDIADISREYSEEYIREKIKIIEESNSYKSGKIASLGAYLKKGLVQNYRPSVSMAGLPQQTVKEQQEQQEQQQKQEESHRLNMESYRSYVCKYAMKKLELISGVENKKVMKEFEQWIQNSIYRGLYKETGLTNILVQDEFVNFIMQAKPQSIVSDMRNLVDFKCAVE